MENRNRKYCQKCGNALDAGESYCGQCGETSRFGSSPPNRIKAPTGVIVLGILQILFSLVSAALVFATPTLESLVGSTFAIAIGVIEIIPLVFAILFLLGFNFARILMLIGAILDIISIVGIIWGIILLWYLTRPRVKAYFTQSKRRYRTEEFVES